MAKLLNLVVLSAFVLLCLNGALAQTVDMGDVSWGIAAGGYAAAAGSWFGVGGFPNPRFSRAQGVKVTVGADGSITASDATGKRRFLRALRRPTPRAQHFNLIPTSFLPAGTVKVNADGSSSSTLKDSTTGKTETTTIATDGTVKSTDSAGTTTTTTPGGNTTTTTTPSPAPKKNVAGAFGWSAALASAAATGCMLLL
jgi:hypothetical protein